MKKTILTLLFAISIMFNSNGQSVCFTNTTDMSIGGKNDEGVVFVKNNISYHFFGYSPYYLTDSIFSYDQNISWQTIGQLTSIPLRVYAAYYQNVSGDSCYVGMGCASPGGTYFYDFYLYDINSNTFTPLASFPDPTIKRDDAVFFYLNGKCYYGLGNFDDGTGQPIIYSDIWEYNPSNNTWSMIDTFPDVQISSGYKPTNFVLGNKFYIQGENSLYEYDPTIPGVWTPINLSFPTTGFDSFTDFKNGRAYSLEYSAGGINLYRFNDSTDQFAYVDTVNINTSNNYYTFTSIWPGENCFFLQAYSNDSGVVSKIWKYDYNCTSISVQEVVENKSNIDIINVSSGIKIKTDEKDVMIINMNGQVVYRNLNYISESDIYLNSGIYVIRAKNTAKKFVVID